jgi:TonB dependent receptor
LAFTFFHSLFQLAIFSGMTTSPGGALSGTASLAGTYATQSNALLSQNFSFYGQDTWKITPKLAVTYGLRWDINPPLKGKSLANDPFTVVGLNDPATMTLAPRGTPLHQTTYGNLAPRLGLVHQLSGPQNWTVVLRGGFGVYYDLGSGSLGGASSYFPYLNDTFATDVPFPLSPQNAAPPALTDSPPVNDLLVAEPNLKLPRTYEWNAALEQSLGSNQTLSLTYIGAVGRDLLRNTDLVQIRILGLSASPATRRRRTTKPSNSSLNGVCRKDCKLWHHIHGPTRLISHRPTPLRTTSTRRAQSRI